MSDTTKTPRLGLTYLKPSQAQPEVIINQAWDILDATDGGSDTSSDSGGGSGAPGKDGPRGRRGRDGTRGRPGIPVQIAPMATSAKSPILIARNMRDVRRHLHRPPGGLNPTGVAAGAYTLSNITIGADGRITAASNGSGGGAGSVVNQTPDSHPSSPTAADDEFEGAAIDLTGARRSGATAWTWLNQVSASAALTSGSLVLTAAQIVGPSLNFLTQPVLGSTWVYTAKIAIVGSSNTASVGMGAVGSTGKLLNAGVYTSGTSTPSVAQIIQRWTNTTTFSANEVITGSVPCTGITASAVCRSGWVYVQMFYDGTNVGYNFSLDGVTFTRVYSEAATAFIGGAPTLIGLYANSANAVAPAFLICDWFRKTA